ncbi:S-adenosyl-L-methionine-dependent methyltransferase [Scenedesmus sp. NREL 46B-D3]|nr:S-adenosyl-L-methionine-dependent methyltransferase [Scenedesmus sp. NREL 46B-D3]
MLDYHTLLARTTTSPGPASHRRASTPPSAAASARRHAAGHAATAFKLRGTHSRAVAVSVGRRELLGGLAPYCCCGSCASNRRDWYDKFFALSMATGMQDYEAAVAPLKQALFSQLFVPLADGAGAATASSSSSSSSTFSVLEVGIGTGPNFQFYPSAASSQQHQLRVTGLEPNAAMWQYAQQAAEAAGLRQQQLQLVAADAQQMPFEPDNFDAAVVTLVLCSVPDPQQALAELLRVVRPGGRLLLIEHVIAPNFGLLQLQQRLLDPLQQLLADNCHLTRDTAAVLQASGFECGNDSGGWVQPVMMESVEAAAAEVGGGGGTLFRFEVPGMSLIAPHIAGILRKPMAVQ